MKILITGATSGIGKATAIKLLEHNHELILIGRRQDRLQEFKNQYPNANIHTITLDVRDKDQVFSQLADQKNIDVLINNAGLASGMEDFADGNLDDWEQMIDTNLKGLIYVTKALLPDMIARQSGHIINIGSTAAKDTYPKGNIYCMTKHGVDAISKSLRIELLPHQIKVTAVHPGMVDTEFSTVRFHGDTDRAAKVYQNIIPLHAEDVAEVIAFAIHRPAHVNLNDIVMTCTAQASAIYSHRTV